MGVIQLISGEIMPLHVNLGAGEAGKYVRAVLKSQSGVAHVSSPVALDDVGDGLYLKYTIPKNSDPFTIADYEIFEDAGFTIRSFPITGDQDSTDVFQLVEGGPRVSRNDTFTARFKGEDTVKAKIVSSKITGDIKTEDFSAKLFEDDRLKAEVDRNTLRGKLKC